MEDKSKLSMQDIFVKEMKYKRELNSNGEKQLSVKHKINYTEISPLNMQVELITEIADDIGDVGILLNFVGIFEYKKEEFEEGEIAEDVLKYNTVAIMMPFVRSQIAVLTSQPGITPIVLPIVDVRKVVTE